MNNFFIVQRNKYFDGYGLRGEELSILCEDGYFRAVEEIMSNKLYIPVLFISKESAKEARKMFGHWPRYKVIKITDPSWLN